MRLHVNIPQVDPTAVLPSQVWPHEDRDREYSPHQKHHESCFAPQNTFRPTPRDRSVFSASERIQSAQKSERSRVIGPAQDNRVMLSVGDQLRGVADFVTPSGRPVDHVTVYRYFQGSREKARQSRGEWLKQASRVRVVGGEPTYVRRRGEDVVIGVTVDAQSGFILTIDVLDDDVFDNLIMAFQSIWKPNSPLDIPPTIFKFLAFARTIDSKASLLVPSE